MVILWWKNKLVAIVCVCVKLDWKKRRLANRKERLTRQPLILWGVGVRVYVCVHVFLSVF